MTVYELRGDDEETYHSLGVYASPEAAAADRAWIEEHYPGRPEWLTFGVEEIDVLEGRMPAMDLERALIAFADLSEIQAHWLHPRPPGEEYPDDPAELGTVDIPHGIVP